MSWLQSRVWWGLVGAALPVWLGLFWWMPPADVWNWPDNPWLLLLVYPVLEELVFRFGLQSWLAERTWGQRQWLGFSIANVVASSVFVLAHCWTHPLLWALAVLPPSLLFGWCYQRWNIVAAITLHIWYNAGYFMLYPSGG